ncbi:MAG TPA: hypothetical protein VII57_06435 [Dehalococcoidia bacterium]
MAEKEFELDDPFQPVAVRLATPGYDGVEAMARCFVEEFALMGWPPERIFKLFTAPQFAGSYSVFQERGEAYVREIIASVFASPEVEAQQAAADVVAAQQSSVNPREGDADGSGL